MGAKDQGTDSQTTQGRWHVIPRTLCFVTYQDKILLLKRAPHKRIFPNHYNGVGGHIERDEDPQSSAIREIYEETGLTVHHIRFCGSTHINTHDSTGILLFIFIGEATSLAFQDSEEGQLEWLSIQDVLAEIQNPTRGLPLVEDLPIILPLIFGDRAKNKPFFAHVSYNAQDQIQLRFAEDK
jgi:8-oxo-dGTP diphosphatase